MRGGTHRHITTIHLADSLRTTTLSPFEIYRNTNFATHPSFRQVHTSWEAKHCFLFPYKIPLCALQHDGGVLNFMVRNIVGERTARVDGTNRHPTSAAITLVQGGSFTLIWA